MARLSITNNRATSTTDDPEKQMQAESEEVPLKLAVKPSQSNEGLSIEQFRALVGIPQEDPPPALPSQTFSGLVRTQNGYHSLSNLNVHRENLPVLPPPIRVATVTNSGFASQGSRILVGLRLFSRPAAARGNKNKSGRAKNEAAEYPTSLYYTLIREESDQTRLCHFYNIVTYTCLLAQLAIASVLIILGAIPGPVGDSDHRIAIAVLGAVTGLLTGLMSLLKGQGLPNRLLQYANRLRQVRDKLEFMEHSLRANVGAIITFQDVVDVFNEFENVRNERQMNRPDVWTTSGLNQRTTITVAQQPSPKKERQTIRPVTAAEAAPNPAPTTGPRPTTAGVIPQQYQYPASTMSQVPQQSLYQQYQNLVPASIPSRHIPTSSGEQTPQQPVPSHPNPALQNPGPQTVHGETTLHSPVGNTNPFASPTRGNSIRISNGTTTT